MAAEVGGLKTLSVRGNGIQDLSFGRQTDYDRVICARTRSSCLREG